jgi:hypothetical protein
MNGRHLAPFVPAKAGTQLPSKTEFPLARE